MCVRVPPSVHPGMPPVCVCVWGGGGRLCVCVCVCDLICCMLACHMQRWRKSSRPMVSRGTSCTTQRIRSSTSRCSCISILR